MNLSIQLTDLPASGPVAVDLGRNHASTTAQPTPSMDGGAPGFSTGENIAPATASSGVLDIGGPPPWLVEAVTKGSPTGLNASEPAAAEGGGMQDAGSAPAF